MNRDGLSPSQTSSLPPACSPWSSGWPPTRSDPANQPTSGRLHVNDQASPPTLPKVPRSVFHQRDSLGGGRGWGWGGGGRDRRNPFGGRVRRGFDNGAWTWNPVRDVQLTSRTRHDHQTYPCVIRVVAIPYWTSREEARPLPASLPVCEKTHGRERGRDEERREKREERREKREEREKKRIKGGREKEKKRKERNPSWPTWENALAGEYALKAQHDGGASVMGPGLVKRKTPTGWDTGRCVGLVVSGTERKSSRTVVCLLKGALTHNTWTLRKIVKPGVEPKMIRSNNDNDNDNDQTNHVRTTKNSVIAACPPRTHTSS